MRFALDPTGILLVATRSLEAAITQVTSDGTGRTDVRNVFNDAALSLGKRVDFFDRVVVSEVENLANGEGSLGGCVCETCEQGGVVPRAAAQVLDLRSATLTNGPVIRAANIRFLITFILGRSSRDIVIACLRPNQQC